MSLLLEILLSNGKLFQGWVHIYGLTFLKALCKHTFSSDSVSLFQCIPLVRLGHKRRYSAFAENVYGMCLKPVGWSFAEHFLPMATKSIV